VPLVTVAPEFADRVERGEKTQTIRAYRKDGRDPKVGDRLYFWTGLRQRKKKARKLGEGIVESVTPIEIRKRRIWVGRGIRKTCLMLHEAWHVALRDGFDSPEAMTAWFDRVHGLPFRGLVIRWRRA
jgi:hypothetical protein